MQLALILAQVTNSVPADTGVNVGAFGTAQFYIDVLTPIIGPLLTAGVKKLMPSLPAISIPAIAIALGVVSNALGTVVLGGDVAIWKAVLLGAAGIGIRELIHNFKPAPQT